MRSSHKEETFYFVIILSIEREWQLSYDELIKLWTLGALLIGIGAIPFGWLSDRWSRSSMMVIMFFQLVEKNHQIIKRHS